jgi:hypothetical protein
MYDLMTNTPLYVDEGEKSVDFAYCELDKDVANWYQAVYMLLFLYLMYTMWLCTCFCPLTFVQTILEKGENIKELFR